MRHYYCKEGGGEDAENLPNAAVGAGAAEAMGFTTTINVTEANPWLNNLFYRHFVLGQAIETAASQMDQEIGYSNSMYNWYVATQ